MLDPPPTRRTFVAQASDLKFRGFVVRPSRLRRVIEILDFEF